MIIILRILIIALFLIQPLIAETINIEYIELSNNSRHGAGILVSPNLCISAGHIFEFQENVPAIIKYDRRAYNGSVIIIDKGADLAAIQLENNIDIPSITLAEKVEIKEEVYFNTGMEIKNIIFNEYATESLTNIPILMFSFNKTKGMSGAPIYNKQNKLVSIISGYTYNSTVGCSTTSLRKIIQDANTKISRK